jgi:hypothetical protein
VDKINKTLLFFNKTLAIQMKDCHYKSVLKVCNPYWLIFQHDIQNLFNFFYQTFFLLMVDGLNIYVHLSLFNILEHSFCFKT